MFRRKAGWMYAAPLSLYFKGLINGSVSVAEVMPIKWKKKDHCSWIDRKQPGIAWALYQYVYSLVGTNESHG